MNKIITIVDRDAEGRKALEFFLGQNNFGQNVRVVATINETEQGPILYVSRKGEALSGLRILKSNVFVKPLRIGMLVERIQYYIHSKHDQNEEAVLTVGPYELDLIGNELSDNTERKIRLTEKEKKILVLLKRAEGQVVERRVLLEKVWDYAETLETHTLETHIYRLRQKIEKDPANPEIILTQDAGYSIGYE